MKPKGTIVMIGGAEDKGEDDTPDIGNKKLITYIREKHPQALPASRIKNTKAGPE